MANKKKEVKDRVNLFSENEIKGNYIPVSEKDLASAINIPVKGVEIETVENMEKIGESKIVEKVIQKG
ncbi:MAG: hypothetical protein U9Q06_04660, partial [Nanoarchaeota archaeon]|nr:hypothetical protein [Nanoarchaeota archaeon]